MEKQKFCKQLKNDNIRLITPEDNAAVAGIIRKNLEKYGLDIPGTAYYDSELDALSDYYNAVPDKRAYFVITGANGEVLGGIGLAEFDGICDCAEIQKLYLSDNAKGGGLGKKLMKTAEEYADILGYKKLYLETHTNLQTAISFYERLGFYRIETPGMVLHSTMNIFYMKDIGGKISEN